MALANLLRHRVDLQRPTVAMDDSRGGVRTYGTLLEGLRCLVQPASAKELLAFRQRNVQATHKIYFAALLDLRPGDRLYQSSASRASLPARYFVVRGWLDQGGQDGRTFCVEAMEQILG